MSCPTTAARRGERRQDGPDVAACVRLSYPPGGRDESPMPPKVGHDSRVVVREVGASGAHMSPGHRTRA